MFTAILLMFITARNKNAWQSPNEPSCQIITANTLPRHDNRKNNRRQGKIISGDLSKYCVGEKQWEAAP
eukprot:scaffold104546_cov26-Prasinocladus_malaysianus.AAC.1